ncbi:hypothetical protein Csa_003014 [Cucumis sativus]|uniref:Uncharacterized protein n=1 Tax=Cucumis sativus TaxID=3659 RepID=A0A0A0KG00_CUCSA|nr:hypothetical protein Csa_003014 [Cucumis sativus]
MAKKTGSGIIIIMEKDLCESMHDHHARSLALTAFKNGAFASVDNGVMHSKWAQNRLYNVYGDQELKIKQSQGI